MFYYRQNPVGYSPCSSGLVVIFILLTVSSADMKCDPAAPPGHCSSTSGGLMIRDGGIFSISFPGAGPDCSSDSQSGGIWLSLGPGEWVLHWHVGPQQLLKALKIICMCFSRSSRSKERGWLVTADMVLNWKYMQNWAITWILHLWVWLCKKCGYVTQNAPAMDESLSKEVNCKVYNPKSSWLSL